MDDYGIPKYTERKKLNPKLYVIQRDAFHGVSFVLIKMSHYFKKMTY